MVIPVLFLRVPVGRIRISLIHMCRDQALGASRLVITRTQANYKTTDI